ncbi:DgyrCDS4055 [Dimorphilus gyrociliatus]|uniref:phosphoenolpyruvate carboxykinase (GTP) n=1 Tax=Dimorphilus gyrociliatus TaxID=2664684 RepID=A0A7I8VHX2_9ANNE|nr:DgyrCDS4055 [Dimorphilus gyrociliatus]
MSRELDVEPEIKYTEVHEIIVPHLGHIPIAKGDFHALPTKAKKFIAFYADYLKPRGIFICDGSNEEATEIIHKLEERGTLEQLEKYENCYVCRTDPADVARVESKTWICTKEKHKTVPRCHGDAKGGLGQWISPEDCQKELQSRFPGCMAGRMMYVIPFSMGPVGSPLSKIGIEITDSNYVLLCMRVMTRVTSKIWEVLGDGDFVKCIHSMGCPRPWRKKVVNHWPCNPERIFIAHFPEERKVKSFGSGYGGNSLLGKKCFALRIANAIARDEGWMAEHMLIMGITKPGGKEHYIAAAFPSACGKTNLAMLESTLPGWKVRCVGDDIAWMRFNEKGELRAINPEAGFFGVAPGTNWKTNPNAMASFQKNSIFTNVAKTDDGSYYWEGLEDEVEDKNIGITTWLGKRWKIGEEGKAAHPNARFCSPAAQCPIIHPKWEDPEGVPIDAILFGGRRPEGVPLVFESYGWNHGVLVGAACKSEATAAAEFHGKKIMHDPMAMRPFMGYNFGEYLDHWLQFGRQSGLKLPKIFHVNWFRTGADGHFLWPGFGDNIRVLDWVCKRVEDKDVAVESAIGYLPTKGSIDLSGIEDKVKWDELFSLPKDYWKSDIEETKAFLDREVGDDLPKEICEEIKKMQERINKM